MADHYKNVEALLSLSEGYDLEKLIAVFENSDLEVLVDDVAYVITKLFAHFSPQEKIKIRKQLMDEITVHSFKEELEDYD